MTTPIIGIVCMDDRPQDGEHGPRFGQNQSYAHAVARAGAAPLLIPLLAGEALLRALYDKIDGLLLPGGVDVHPKRYGEEIHEKCGSISEIRDEVELVLIRWAMADHKPLLAICRGIQVLNVALGGSLYQDIRAQVPEADRHDCHTSHARNQVAHDVAIAPDSRLAYLVGTGLLPVNSFHHQAVKEVAPGLMVSAQAPDGIIEAVEGEGRPFVLGVQWHPEEMAAEDDRAQWLFDALVEASKDRF
ncbi:MAG: gamma-glutamyl-gamma-aminobutyrate hydrolase family protein [Anaerolineae bacterium]|nr:gamma-glutamyl-gamma-aminobutyrate hydrolase family protein [Anaerolineae bacterium]